MRFILTQFRAYPRQSAIMLLALLCANFAEGIGLSAVLPLLNLAIKQNALETGGAQASAQVNEFERMVLDQLHGLGITPSFGILLLIIVLSMTFKSGLLLIAQRYMGYTSARIATDIRLSMLRTILASRWEYFLHQPIGRFANSLTSEAQRTSTAYVFGINLITILIQTLVYTTLAVLVSWKATLGALSVGIIIVVVLHFLVRMARKAGKNQTTLMKSLTTRVSDTLQSVKPLKAMAREDLADSVLEMETCKLNKALEKEVFSVALLGAAQEELFIIIIAIGIYLALMAWSVPFATVTMLVILLGRILSQIGKVQKLYQKMAVNETAFWSLQEGIEEARRAREQLGDGGVRVDLKSDIQLSDIGFSYDERPILEHLSMEIPAGSLTTIIGPSGSGKTTIVDLVIGLLRPQSGQVLIDGVPLDEIDIKDWRHKIGYVPQESLLLHDSIAHNVTLGDTALDESDVEYALRAAGAWEFVAQMPKGIHSTVGERGAKLSGGQRQRIMIARALARRPRLLILDEATSALDPMNENAVTQAMEALRGDLTILAISHQTAMVRSADRVYRLEDGKALRVTEQ